MGVKINNYYIKVSLVIIIVVFSAWLLTSFTKELSESTYKLEKRYIPISMKLHSIISDHTKAHLWLEEFLSGDKSITIENIDDYYRSIDNEMFQLSKLNKDKELITFYKKIYEIHNNLNIILKKRLSDFSHSAAGTENDINFDSIYNQLIDSSAQYLDIVHNRINSSIDHINTLREMLLITISIIILITTVLIIIYLREQKTYQSILEAEVSKKSEELIHKSRLALIGEMLSMIAHQWRQPLSAISATASNMKVKLSLESYDLSNAKGKDEFNSYFFERIDSIFSYVKILSQTINDFRNFYKPNNELIETSITSPIKKALHIIQPTLNTYKIEIIEKFICKRVLPMHENEIMQVILNIIKNAQDNFQEKNIKNGKIQISTKEHNKDYIIDIWDNGGGIPEDIIKKIFDPYFSTKNEKQGTGLGLYMSKTIVEEHHNGTLDVKNVDGGTLFSIRLKDTLKK